MNYKETLDFLYAQLPMFQRIGAAAYKKDLGNTLALCETLGNPHRKYACIHIAGTNGKGSVSNMLSAICQAAGLKTGLYTSPHYRDFRERIRINGRLIGQKKVVDFVQSNLENIEKIKPSFFELTVAMAFDHFAKEQVDVAIVEVGLGGRLDSTNVVTPLLSVITNISYDHMDLLGDTLEKIAGEKAGIIKAGIPVVVGETHPESAPVFREKAREMKAPLLFADAHWQLLKLPDEGDDCCRFTIINDGADCGTIRVGTTGPYQEKNLATVLQSCAVLKTIPFFREKNIDWETAVGKGLERLREFTGFMGRWQIIAQNPMVICDSAHNEGGLRPVFERVRQIPHRQLHLVTGSVNDKDLNKTFPLYPKEAQYYFAKANIPRGLDAGILREKAAAFGLQGKAYRSVKGALAAARRAALPDDLILVTGSIFVVAEVLPAPKNF